MMPQTVFCHNFIWSIYISKKDHIHPNFFYYSLLWEGKIFTVCCVGTSCNVFKQTETKSYLLSVINSMKFVETLCQIIVHISPTFCYSLSYICLISCTNINATYFLYTGQIWVKQCCITHSLSMRDWIDKSAYNDRLTHLLWFIWCYQRSKLSHVTHFL